MSQTYISKALRARIAEQAQHRCGYCLSQEAILGSTMTIDHIMPEALGGLSEEENLWLACSQCNEHKGYRTTGIDPESGERTTLFNPRNQVWNEHFVWSESGALIAGKTSVGRATVAALNLNRHMLVEARRMWVLAG